MKVVTTSPYHGPERRDAAHVACRAAHDAHPGPAALDQLLQPPQDAAMIVDQKDPDAPGVLAQHLWPPEV